MRGAAFSVLITGWFERRDFWPIIAAGVICTLVSVVVEDRDADRTVGPSVGRCWNWPFWIVLALSLPSFTAVSITTYLLIWGASSWALVLPVLLYFYVPVGLVVSAIVAAFTQRSMSRERGLRLWGVLALALSAVPLTIVLLWLAAPH